MKEILTTSTEETLVVGEKLGARASPGDIVALYGDLGTGKTVLVKGMAKGLGVKREIVSPTYMLIREYEGRIPLYHFDLYRLDSLRSIQDLGYEEYLYGNGLAAIEWAEKLASLISPEHLRVELEDAGPECRKLRFIPRGARYERMIISL